MDKKRLLRYFLKTFTNRYIVTILLLLSLLPGTSGHGMERFTKWGQLSTHKSEPHSRIFLIAVIDSDDEIIGKRCEKYLEEMTENFDDFSSWLDRTTLVTKIIKGNEFSKSAVNDALNNWLKAQHPSRADVVIFYYSGHGFRFSNDVSVYPRMWLKTTQDRQVETTNLSLEADIFDPLVKMGAGVNIVLSDCCNSVPGANTAFAVTMTPHIKKHPGQEEMENDIEDFDKLFMPDHPMSIIATAADSTELAGGTPTVGGFFTHFFLEALNKSIFDEI